MTNSEPTEVQNVVLEPDRYEKNADFDQIFGRSAPLHIEIGSGKGTFLVSQAGAFPEINFLGMEWASRYYRYAVDRFERWSLGNVRMMRTDAAWYIAEHVADACVDQYHLYFPDPWHKKRHNKRRLICDENMEQFLRTMKAGAVINIATDHQDYHEWMKDVFSRFEDRLEYIPFIRAAGAKDGEMVGTNFERKYIVQGRSVYTIAVKKK